MLEASLIGPCSILKADAVSYVLLHQQCLAHCLDAC